ncbi:hypothetical protein ACO1O0_003765 [Amphichorda felina]
MSLEIVVLDHLPAAYTVHIALFRNVRNAAFLHSQLLARNPDFEYGLVDASIIASRLHLLSAVFKAVVSAASNTLKTPNVHSEIVTCLSASSNIAEAYRRYGISPSTKDLLVIKVAIDGTPSTEQISEHLSSNIEGDIVPVTDQTLAGLADFSKLSKYYKLNGLKWLDGIKDKAAKHKEIEMLILGGMALRGV